MNAKHGMMAVLLVVGAMLGAEPVLAGTISPGLQRQLADHQPDDVVRVLVVLPDQVDVVVLDRTLRADKAARSHRHGAIVRALQDQAKTTQQNLVSALNTDKSGGGIRSFTPHWLINAVVVTGTVTAVRELALRPDVLRVEADLVPELIEPVASWLPAGKTAQGIGLVSGVAAIGAPRVWRELGIDGSGTLVGVIDSGVDVSHPSLSTRWRGNFADPATAWLDVAQMGSPLLPADALGHGTHVMGTITGLAPGDTIGVAPGAQWLATNGIAASGTAFDNAIIASLEFMTDPDGDPTTTVDVPDVVENSWGINEAFAGYVDCDSRWWEMIDNCEAAGVVLVWSAGNEGGGGLPGTIRSPADRATNPYNCFSVGSTSNHEPFLISDFSSRGPSGCGGPYAVKPELTAPGDTIYSALPGGGYIYRNGTSMAGPHVAGVVALMRQANPDVDVTTIKEILLETSRDLGTPGEDNDYGHGLVDAFAAVQAVLGGIGTVTGTVNDSQSQLPIAGALVTRTDGFNHAHSNAQGQYSLTIKAGAAIFTVTAFGYSDASLSVTIPDGGVVNGDLVMTPLPTGTLSGVVRGPDSRSVVGATIVISDTPLPTVTTDTSGFYSVDLPLGAAPSYTLRVSAPGLGSQVVTVEMTGDLTLDIALPELTWEDFESGGFQVYPWQFGGDAPWLIDDTQAFEGQLSAGSGTIGDAEMSELRLDYYVAVAGELRFRYKVSSEFSFDFFDFLVDDTIIASGSGEIDWTLFTTSVPVGNHTFVWRYVKDEVIGAGFDRAWVDLVEFPSTGIEPQPQLAYSPLTFVVGLAPGMSTTRTATLTNIGTADLQFTLSIILVDGKVAGYLHSGLATSSAPADSLAWVSVSPLAGSIPPGESTPITILMDATETASGLHIATLNMASNDVNNANALIALNLTVGAASAVPGVVTPVLRLTGAVPNPFNPRTEIHYVLPAAGRLTLAVYDLGGRVVQRLVATTEAAGPHLAVWNGRDEQGRTVASGTYFARLVFAGESRVKAMSLVR